MELRRASRGGALVAALAVVATSATLLWPVLSVEIPPLSDLPNHMAVLHILSTIDSDPFLQRNYDVSWSLQPNLGLHLISIPLASWLDAFQIGRVLVALALLLPLLGSFLLHRVLYGRFGLWPLAAGLFVFNQCLALGFINYLLGAGLAIFGVALWLHLSERPAAVRIVVGTGLGLLLYITHLMAFLAYGLIVVLEAAGAGWQERKAAQRHIVERLTFAIVPLLPAIAITLSIRVDFAGDLLLFGGMRAKMMALVSPTLFHAEILDFVVLVLVLCGIVWGLASRRIVVHPRLRLPLLGLLVAAMLMPHYARGMYALDWRLPFLILCLFFAASEPRFGAAATRLAWAGAIAVLLISRSVAMTDEWRRYDAYFAEFREATASMDRGARLLVAESTPADVSDLAIRRYAVIHLAALSVIDSSAFLPTLFTFATPLRASASTLRLDAHGGEPQRLEELWQASSAAGRASLAGAPRYWHDWTQDFDYLVHLHFGGDSRDLQGLPVEMLRTGSFFDVMRITSRAANSAPTRR